MGSKLLKEADSCSKITYSKILFSCNKPYQKEFELADARVMA